MKLTRSLLKPALFALTSILLIASGASAQPPAITTQMVNNAHTNWNSNETTLTVANVKSSAFQMLFQDTIDDGTYFQPLYVPGVNLGAQGTHNVIIVGTENNTVYAFDADTQGAPLWQVSLTPSGETLQNMNDYANTRIPHMGISGTGVIDTSTNTLYVVAASKTTSSPTTFYQRIHALDITTGKEKFGGPVIITAKYLGSGGEQDGNGNVIFDPLIEFDRAGLTLLGNNVYIPWSAHEDNGYSPSGPTNGGEYQGWVMAYNKTSLAQTAVYNDSPNLASGTGGGSIWQSAVGMVTDGTSIYALTANGAFDQNTGGGDYGDSLLRLTTPSLSIGDYFTPCNQAALDMNDVDLASGAPMILPTQSNGPANLLTFSGKEGTIYLINRSSLGSYTATTVPDSAQCSDNVVQELWRVLGTASNSSSDRNAFWGAPAFFADNSGRQYVYYTGDYAPIFEYDLKNATLAEGQSPGGNPNQTPTTSDGYDYARGGTLPAISSNGGDTSTAILWAIRHPTPATSAHGTGTLMLDAFPANDLTTEIVNDVPAGNWTFQNDAFITPTIANGKVYVASSGQLDVFGLNNSSGSATPTATATSTSGPTPTATATPSSTPTPVPGKLWVNRVRMNFGRVKVGDTRQIFLRFGDAGKGVLHITIPSLSAPFTIESNPGTLTLTRGQGSQRIYVQFAPTSTDPVPGQTLTITSDDPKRPTVNIEVLGTGR
jgi:hypothetical protein